MEYDHCIRCGSKMIDINGNCPICDGAIEHETIVKFRDEINDFINSMMNN